MNKALGGVFGEHIVLVGGLTPFAPAPAGEHNCPYDGDPYDGWVRKHTLQPKGWQRS